MIITHALISLIYAASSLPYYPESERVRELVLLTGLHGDTATLDVVFNPPPWARTLLLYLPEGARVDSAGWTVPQVFGYRYEPPPVHPLTVKPIGSVFWSPEKFVPPEGLEGIVGYRWELFALPSPGPGRLVWIRVEVPVRDGWVVWPAPMIDGLYVYGGFDRAVVLREGEPPSVPSWDPFPPSGDSFDLVPVFRDAPALVVSSTGYHRYVLLLHPCRPGPYVFGPDVGLSTAVILGSAALWVLDRDPVRLVWGLLASVACGSWSFTGWAALSAFLVSTLIVTFLA